MNSYALFLGSISKDFIVYYIKKLGYAYNFLVDLEFIDVDDILGIYKNSVKKHDIK